MFCKNCGNPIEENEKFCNKCGKSVPLNYKKKSSNFWEKYKISNISLETSEKYIKNAFIAGLISIAITLLAALFIDRYFWIDVVLVTLLVFGVYKKNLPSTVALFVYFILAKIIQIVSGQNQGWLIWIIAIVFAYYFFVGMLGAVAYHRLTKHEHKRSTKRWFIYGILIGLFLSGIIGYLVVQKVYPYFSEETVLFRADYEEGYKAGYVDGRSAGSNIGDNYSSPATEERKNVYFQGYLEGFLKGCGEGNFDCNALEKSIRDMYSENKLLMH